jgi:16S rRNA processing protein RimM
MGATSSSRSSPTPSERRRAIARVLGPKGLDGGIRVELLTDWPERIAPGAEVWLEDSDRPMHIDRIESGRRTPVLHLDGVASREQAEALVGTYLEGVAQELEEGAYYWDDLVGLRVRLPDGTDVGELVEVFRAGGNEVYRVVGGSGERLVPALRSVVRDIDLATGVMVVAPDESEEVR